MTVRHLFAASVIALAPSLSWAETAGYLLTAPTASGKVGAASSVKVEIKPKAGYHMNDAFPTSLKLTPHAEVTHAGRLDKSSPAVKVEKTGASFDVQLTPSKAGKKEVVGSLSFAICSETTCEPQKVPVTLTVDVK